MAYQKSWTAPSFSKWQINSCNLCMAWWPIHVKITSVTIVSLFSGHRFYRDAREWRQKESEESGKPQIVDLAGSAGQCSPWPSWRFFGDRTPYFLFCVWFSCTVPVTSIHNKNLDNLIIMQCSLHTVCVQVQSCSNNLLLIINSLTLAHASPWYQLVLWGCA